jgi:hypothetical protein
MSKLFSVVLKSNTDETRKGDGEPVECGKLPAGPTLTVIRFGGVGPRARPCGR